MNISQENASDTLEKIQQVKGDLVKARAARDAAEQALQKAQTEHAEALSKITAERDEIRQALAKANGEIEALRKMPAAPKGALRVVQRTQENHELGTTLAARHEGPRNA